MNSWEFFPDLSIDQFIDQALSYGKLIETSLVGSFQNSGRGSKRDIPLPLHRDGDYSTSYKDKIDYIALYCIRPGPAYTLVEFENKVHQIKLMKSNSIIINNKICRHGRSGSVRDRLLLRLWIQKT